MVTVASGSCALCGGAATIADWSPRFDWLTVDGCPCRGFFVWKGVWNLRLPGMLERERRELATRVRDWRAGGREAWISIEDGTLTGPLVIFPERPSLAQAPGDLSVQLRGGQSTAAGG